MPLLASLATGTPISILSHFKYPYIAPSVAFESFASHHCRGSLCFLAEPLISAPSSSVLGHLSRVNPPLNLHGREPRNDLAARCTVR